MDKEAVARMTAAAGATPVKREQYDGHEIFISDGFTFNAASQYSRFGVELGDFPNGAYVTMWWVAKGETRFEVGAPIFFKPDHDFDLFMGNKNLMQQARVNAAVATAKQIIDWRKKVRRNGLILN
jgi:hypothetical protein